MGCTEEFELVVGQVWDASRSQLTHALAEASKEPVDGTAPENFDELEADAQLQLSGVTLNQSVAHCSAQLYTTRPPPEPHRRLSGIQLLRLIQ